MQQFKRWNNLGGWLTFLAAAIVYLLTIEPTVSYWDCGEFITCASKLEVGHAPGAPLFLMMARVFSLLAPGVAKVAMTINAFSALASAFTVLFLVWTITHLARKIMVPDNNFSTGKTLTVLGAGLVGALAFAFSDSFWFSAVEAEVYATSALFTAVVFWAILKWEDEAHEAYSNRWIILIAYLMGLSIGVHLLNLLTISALVLVYYFKKFKTSKTGFVLAVLVSFGVVGVVQYGIIPGVIELAAQMELLFVNRFGFPYNSGVVAYAILLTVFLLGSVWLTYAKGKVVANTVMLALTMIILGYSSYSMIVIRSMANTPLNENTPNNVFTLLSYLNREQYGERPLLYGQYYNAPIVDSKEGAPIYVRENGKYIVSTRQTEYVYDSRFTTVFPRMYSSDADHIKVYKAWGGSVGKPMTVDRNGQQVVDYRPSFLENITFFLKYQVGYMYFRYFMWNFSGKQNDMGGNGGVVRGNWMTGISVVDRYFLGPQDKLPTLMKDNKGRNRYFLLPLILGLIGAFYQLQHRTRGFMVVALLFFMTGLAIVLYLNQTPLQVRERDYAYAGSFYAFAIWIGMGVLALAQWMQRYLSRTRAAIASTSIALLAVPALMASQNWDDHDRSGRYTAHDVAYNYLNSCAANAILFTDGDNDTFPLWYLQEVEGIRTDVRVVNLTLLASDWYIDQMKCRANQSAPLPISLGHDKYRQGKRDAVYLVDRGNGYLTVNEAIAQVASDDSTTKYKLGTGELLDYLPTKNFILPVDSQRVIANGTVSAALATRVPSQINFHINNGYLSKSDLMVMDILANNHWERPVYYVSANQSGTLGLDNYLQLEGFAYRLTPIYTEKTGGYFSTGRVESSVMYDRFMHQFRWGRMNQPGVLIDNYNLETFGVLRMRVNFARLTQQLFIEGKRDSAMQVLDRCLELMPASVVPHDVYSFRLIEAAYLIGANTKADRLVDEFAKQCLEELRYYKAMPWYLSRFVENEQENDKITIDRLADITVAGGNKAKADALRKELK
jgi:hypothetical protein